MSSTLFTPALTTVIGVTRRGSAGRLTRRRSRAAPRCTPPSPPVANTRMPASAARCAVAATVVAPLPPRAARIGRSRTLALASSSSAIRRTPSSSRPIRGTPSSTAIVAGVTPRSRRIASNSRAASRLRGRGRPWEMIVDSRATTGRDAARASATSAERCKGDIAPTLVGRERVPAGVRSAASSSRDRGLPGGAGLRRAAARCLRGDRLLGRAGTAGRPSRRG